MMWRYIRKQQLKPAELRKLQDRKLRALIRHSYEYVPYYHSLFKAAKLSPDDIRTVNELYKIPVTRKRDIRNLPSEEVVASDIDSRKCWVLRTSGTSGTSLAIYWEKKAYLTNQLLTYFWQLKCGDKMTKKRVAIGTSWPAPTSLHKIGIFRTRRISPFDDVKTQIEQIKEYGPYTMHAYPSCLRVLGKEIMEKDIQGVAMNLLFPTGELLDEYTRKLAVDVFDADLFDSYGAMEVGRISNECVEHDGYHTVGESIIVEVTKDGEPIPAGEEGEVTVTNLVNYAMPFIRYDLEDLGMLVEGECSCGSYLPRMRLTEGRRSHIMRLPDGRTISALAVIGVLNNVQGISQFQIAQEEIDHFAIRVVRGARFTDKTVEEVGEVSKPILGDVDVEVSVVPSIPRETSGKFRPFITKVPA